MTGLLLVTLVSMVLAIVMSAIAWRASREERRRADARVDLLAADIQEAVAGSRPAPTPSRPIRLVPSTSNDLFAAGDSSTASSRSIVVVCAGLFVFATAAALAVVFSTGSRATANPPAPISVENRAQSGRGAASFVPLELVALGQEREGDHLIVRGVLRNPPSGTRVDRLVAVVFLFDADGGFLTSGRAVIDSAMLLPGGESAFLVNIPDAARVARYRVSFRTDTAVIPHVDKRHAS